MKDFGTKNSTGYRYFLVVIGTSSTFAWFTKKTPHTLYDSFGSVLKASKQSPKLNGTDDRKKFGKNIVTDSLKKTIIKRYSHYTTNNAVFAERVNIPKRDLPKNLYL